MAEGKFCTRIFFLLSIPIFYFQIKHLTILIILSSIASMYMYMRPNVQPNVKPRYRRIKFQIEIPFASIECSVKLS